MAIPKVFISSDTWYLESADQPGTVLQGQFPGEADENISSNFAQYTSLNRETQIVQFISGNSDQASFDVKLRARDSVFNNVIKDLNQLKKWAKRDSKLKRPTLVNFWIGDGFLSVGPCFITQLSGIKYDKPTSFGAVLEVNLKINLIKYTEFSFDSTPAYETRYHRAKYGDYYEWICQREYNNPLLGDVIRKRHPSKPNIQMTDIVKLPSVEAIRKEIIEPKSIPLITAYGRKVTPQRTLRIFEFDRHNRTHVSHILKG